MTPPEPSNAGDSGGLEARRMRTMLMLVATSVGGGIGWWLGAGIGPFTAVVASAVGTAVALVVVRRAIDAHLP